MSDKNVNKSQESNECRWWQRHKWTKWQEESTEEIKNQHRDYIKHILRRTCERCGSFEFKTINQYYGESK